MTVWEFFGYTLILVLSAGYFGWILRGALRPKGKDARTAQPGRGKGGRFVSLKQS